MGKKLKQKEAFILDVIRLNLRKNGFHIKNLIAGERKFSENIYEKLNDADLAIREREEFMKNKKQNPINNNFNPWKKKELLKNDSKETKKTVNHIDAEEIINKENYVYIKDLKFKVLLDSGAEDNYMSESIANKIKMRIQTYEEPKIRYTCIRTPFYIKNYVVTNFRYKEKEEKTSFDILPYRKDDFIIIGREFMAKQTKENGVNSATKEDEIEELLEKLCNRQETKEINYKCHIPTKPGEVATGGTYFVPYAEEKQINEEISRLLKLGYIRPSTSMWLNKLKPVIKPNGNLRITLNLIKLNQLVSIDRYTLPNMEEMIYKLNGQKIFSKIDLKEGFFQIPLAEEDRHKTAFRVKNKLYEWTRMPMGFKNSSAVFQRYMDGILGHEIGKSCFVYVDDILIFGKTMEEHDKNLKKVLKILIKNGVMANWDKVELGKKQVTFLGHKLSFNKIEPHLNPEQPIETYPRPTDLETVRKFHGLINYYRKFIPNLSTIIEPILNLTRKNVKFEWTNECEGAFMKLKDILLSELVLRQPDYSKKFFLETDASNVGLGAILSQEHNNTLYPIAFKSEKWFQLKRITP